MIIPSSTYRLQISKTFTLEDVKQIIPYLKKLGISTIYAAPIFTARPGSTHGYDVTDPHTVNPEVGTLAQLEEIATLLKEQGMSWVQDIVPNHMAFDTNNEWLMDVMEKGKRSRYCKFFDINWYHPEPRLKDKLMTPFLGAPIDEVIESGDLSVSLLDDRLVLMVYDNPYPLSLHSYHTVFTNAVEYEADSTPNDFVQELAGLSKSVKLDNPEAIDKFDVVKRKLAEAPAGFKDTIEQLYSDDISLLKALLKEQNFRLTYWRSTEERINYRRFFTVNDLICLQMEDKEVFDHYHQFIKSLYEKGCIHGVRVDHVDGLNDPTIYMERLRDLLGDKAYIIVEKILEWEEKVPRQWPVQGTSGYGFLASVSHLFTEPRGKDKFQKIYDKYILDHVDFKALIFEKKYFIFKNRMAGELDNLMHLLLALNIMPAESFNSDENVKEALAVFLVCFPVYRIYSNEFPLPNEDAAIIDKTFTKAMAHAPHLSETFADLRQVFSGQAGDTPEVNEKKLQFFRRCQQYTGPLEAKGVEDTSFYIYNRLISHNEVGDTPEVFGIDAATFHERMQRRFKNTPLGINATATHDTKRGEDARLRINALSEIPETWEQHIQVWMKENETFKTEIGESLAPTKNDEYFIYQTILGVLDMDGKMEGNFVERVQEYMLKVVREAKENSSWAEPNEAYEQAVSEFVEAILGDNRVFLTSFLPIFRQAAKLGTIYSLGQLLIKITAPGIPDIYQGTEFWDLSMVDPDNRRPVDYQHRMGVLDQIIKDGQNDLPQLLSHLMTDYANGNIKMFVMQRALSARLSSIDLFQSGDYLPLEVVGDYKENILAYARSFNHDWCIIVVPKLLGNKLSEGEWPVGMKFWGETKIVLPKGAPKKWVNVFTDDGIAVEDHLFVEQALSTFPVAILKSSTI